MSGSLDRRLGFGEECAQFEFHHPRVEALEDGDDSFQYHLLDHELFVEPDLELACSRQKEEIGGGYAIDGSHEGNRDAAPHLVDIVQMLHNLNQAEYRTDDADGGRKSAGRFEDLGDSLLRVGLIIQLQFHDLSELDGIGAVDCQGQGLAHVRILYRGDLPVEGDYAAAAGFVGEVDQLLERGFAIRWGSGEYLYDLLGGFQHGTQGELHHDSAQRSSEHDQGSGRLQQLADASALHHQAGYHASDRDYNSTDAALIHVQLLTNLRYFRSASCALALGRTKARCAEAALSAVASPATLGLPPTWASRSR